MLVHLPGREDAVGEVVLVDGVRVVLGLQAEGALAGVDGAGLADQGIVHGEEVAWKI